MPGGRIVFDHVWKRFHRGPAHDSLRDLLPALVRRARPGGGAEETLGSGDFWAVRDLSFEVTPGQALGIIGGNGAGKSTTLKLLTRILQPTRGFALVEGRVGSLIEVSAGFHPDLTGRENVFLQGAIMGMPQRLIRERFDEIVDFSGVSESIDTPVKRYSSGMNARLGFSIAVHLEPEALIIDEVLSVGDASFQNRAFERIRSIVRSDIPVVIVSHQLDRIVELCTSTILLSHGAQVFAGPSAEAVGLYLRGEQSEDGALTGAHSDVPIRFTGLEALSPVPVLSGESLRLRIGTHALRSVPDDTYKLEVNVYDVATNRRVYQIHLAKLDLHPTGPGDRSDTIVVQMNLPAGLYRFEAMTWDVVAMRRAAAGPSLMVQVEDRVELIGTHQLNARRDA
ncbi:MAG TPA: ABC transporter ATP-binding protein [Gemmatimonadales bacterium]|nr:ABC transporter ATP-binding protein [Gemmatimonadales bacterium]